MKCHASSGLTGIGPKFIIPSPFCGFSYTKYDLESVGSVDRLDLLLVF